jgi:hypothetical protein
MCSVCFYGAFQCRLCKNRNVKIVLNPDKIICANCRDCVRRFCNRLGWNVPSTEEWNDISILLKKFALDPVQTVRVFLGYYGFPKFVTNYEQYATLEDELKAKHPKSAPMAWTIIHHFRMMFCYEWDFTPRGNLNGLRPYNSGLESVGTHVLFKFFTSPTNPSVSLKDDVLTDDTDYTMILKLIWRSNQNLNECHPLLISCYNCHRDIQDSFTFCIERNCNSYICNQCVKRLKPDDTLEEVAKDHRYRCGICRIGKIVRMLQNEKSWDCHFRFIKYV